MIIEPSLRNRPEIKKNHSVKFPTTWNLDVISVSKIVETDSFFATTIRFLLPLDLRTGRIVAFGLFEDLINC